MKVFFAALLLLIPLSGFALSRQSATPVLHSVFDERKCGYSLSDGPRKRLPWRPHERVRLEPKELHQARVNINILVGSSILTTLGVTGIVLVASAHDYSFPDGHSGADGFFTIISAVLLAAGIGMIVVGYMMLTHSTRHTIE